MAKLSKGNLAMKKDAQGSRVDDWNPPLVSSSTAAQMLPPKSRPVPRVPSTPSGNSHTKSANSEIQDSSSKKRRRRRGGKRNGDSASEVATTLSEDIARSVTSTTHDAPEVLVPASQSSMSLLPPNASAEEIRVFENEPEMYGLYAISDGEDQEGEEQSITVPPRQTRVQAHSPSVVIGLAESPPVTDLQEESVQPLRATSSRPQIGSDVASSNTVQIPNPKKLTDGKFECPFKVEYGCTKTFARADGAKRHADAHIATDRFKCEKCAKGFSRQDKFAKHAKTHDKQNGAVKLAETARTKHGHGAHSNGVVDNKEVKKGKLAANVSNSKVRDRPNKRDNEAIVPSENEKRTEDGHSTSDSDSVQSETDDEAQFISSRNPQNDDIQRSDGEHDRTGGERSIEQYDADNIPNTPTERTLSSSPRRALSSVEISHSSVVNGRMKRKRSSPRASPELDNLPSQKRVRRVRDQTLHSPSSSRQVDVMEKSNGVFSPAKKSKVAESRGPRDKDVEMTAQNGHKRKDRSNSEEDTESDLDPGSSTDVEMKDEQRVQQSEHESASNSDDEATRSPTPISEKVKTSNIESAAAIRIDDNTSNPASKETEEDDIEEQEEAGDSSDADADSELPQDLARISDAPPPTVRRQSSMDDFVQRSKSATTSTRASASRPSASVDIPLRSRTQFKKAQSKLLLQGKQSTNIPPADDSEGESSVQRAEPKVDVQERSQALRKGKGKARVKDASSRNTANETEEKTSSEDRPRATTVARRTPSLGSKSAQQPKNRTVSKKRTKPTSDSDGSEQVEKLKSKPKRPSKKKAKSRAEEESEEKDKAKRRGPVSTAASTAKSTWAEASKSGLTGKFAEEEIQTLNAWRDAFCEENNLTAYEFNEMMMNSASVSKSDWRYGWISKADFMQQYYEQLPNRNRRSMIRFRERHFVNADKTPWTEDHDKELRQLVAEHGAKWVEIAQIMGRTQDAVNQRWRHKLNYGEKPALMGEWTTEEVQRLEDEVMAFARMKNTTPDDEDLQIPWIAISKKMGNGRTAQQCSNRWRINTSRRVKGKFVKVPHSDRLPGTKVKKPRTPSKMEKRLSGQGKGTPKSDKVYKSVERIEDSDGEEEEEDRDADDEGNDARDNEEPEADDEQGDLDNDEEQPEAASGEDEQENDGQQSEEDSANSSEEADMVSDSEQGPSSPKDAVQRPVTATVDAIDKSTAATKSSSTKDRKLPQNASSSQPIPKTTQENSHSQSPSSTQLQPLPSSSQPPTFKTPAISKNPLKRASRTRSSPDLGLSLSQIHAGTQANSSAKRTTGRSNRTRVLDSAITEDRPSPGLSLRRRPIRSSSPLMSPLIDVAHGTVAGDGDEDEEDESSDDGSGNGNLELDFKSPTSFVSARDTAGPSASDNDDDENEEGQSSTDDEADSNSSSSSSSSSNSDSNPHHPSTENNAQQDSGSFWQSIHQNFKKLTGLSQEGSGSGSGQSQSQSQDQDQGGKGKEKGKLSLTDVLRRGAVDDSVSDDDD